MYKFQEISKWVRFKYIPVELMHAQILFNIGDCLGGFIGLEKNWCRSSDIKMLINFDSCIPQLKPIIFTIANCKYYLEPELYDAPVSNHLVFKLSPSSLVRK